MGLSDINSDNRRNSFVYNLDPRAKIFVSAFITVLAFALKKTISLVIVFAFCVFLTIVSRISFIKIFKKNWLIILISAFSIILNTIFTLNFNMFIRLLSIILINSLSMITISLNNISHTVEKMFEFTKLIGINPRSIALTVNISIRFVYIMLKEIKKVYESKRSRGADLFNKNLIKRIKLYVSILMPVFVLSMQKTDEFAQALESKSYDFNNKTTTLIEYKFHKNDFLVCFITILLGIVVILCEMLTKS